MPGYHTIQLTAVWGISRPLTNWLVPSVMYLTLLLVIMFAKKSRTVREEQQKEPAPPLPQQDKDETFHNSSDYGPANPRTSECGAETCNDAAPLRRLWVLCPKPNPASSLPPASEGCPLHLDRLAVAARRNAAECLLGCLPEELLMEILSYLDGESLFCLRRTCRLFLRLFCSQELHQFHLKKEDQQFDLQYPGQPWIAQSLDGLDRFLLWRRLAHWVFCLCCLGKAHRVSKCDAVHPSIQQIFLRRIAIFYCSGCGVDHRWDFFSQAQRQKPGEKRVCIAHEGHVRLCAHRKVTASTVAQAICYNEGNQQSDQLLVNDARIICDHPSHAPLHHTFNRPKSQSEESRTAYEASSPASIDFPEFSIHDSTVNGIQRKVATWSYTAHVDLSRYGDEPITAQTFRDCIAALQKCQGPIRFLAPAGCRAMRLEERCVDPTRCGCLVYPGLRTIADEQERSCLAHEATRVLSRPVGGGLPDTLRIRLSSCDLGRRCLRIDYRRTFRLGNPTLASAERRYREARVEPNARPPIVPGGLGFGWYQALDPDSVGVSAHDWRIVHCCHNRTSCWSVNYIARSQEDQIRTSGACDSMCYHGGGYVSTMKTERDLALCLRTQ